MTLFSQRMAVDIISNQFVLLQLGLRDNNITVNQLFSHPLETPLPKALSCQSLMTVMEHRAVHYQQLAEQPSLQEIRENIRHTLGTTQDDVQQMLIDHQHQNQETVVITGHPAQIARRQQQLAPLNKPVTVVEPAFQAVLRAVNYLLPSHWPAAYFDSPSYQWTVVQLAQPLAIVMYCRRGDMVSLNFRSFAEVRELSQLNHPVFFFGPDDLCRSLAELTESPLFIQLQLPAHTGAGPFSLTAGQHMSLFGLALRGFNHWHH